MKLTFPFTVLCIFIAGGCSTADAGTPEYRQSRKTVDTHVVPAPRSAGEIQPAEESEAESEENLTPTDQSEKTNDLAITREIRRSIIADARMSNGADNIKIITIDGNVTLRGRVENQLEKKEIEQKAKEVDNVRSVNNQLEINKEGGA